MKTIFYLVMSLMVCMGASAAEPQTAAQELIQRLKAIQKKGMMAGHQDDPMYGRSWKWEKGRSDVKEVCGDYPAVMGFELGGLELGRETSIDGVPFARIQEEIVDQHLRGGISTVSWHPFNPSTGENAWDPSGNAVKEVLKGGAQYEKFGKWLDMMGTFLNSLKTPDGKKVPVIFRPWHEMSGGWFWWGTKETTPEQFKQLFIYTYEKLTQEHGCDHLVWAYSPNTGYKDYMEHYPGDEYVDLLGIDIYDFEHNNDKYTANVKHDLTELTRIGKEHDKLIALTETGAQRIPDPNWFTQVFWEAVKDFPISYTLWWRNAWDTPKEIYMSAPGHPTEPDFRKFAKQKKTLFVKDIKNIK